MAAFLDSLPPKVKTSKMPRCNDIAKILIIGFVCCFVLGLDAQQKGHPAKSLAAQCGAEVEAAPERVFANPGSKNWKEYVDVKHVPPLDLDSGERMFAVKTAASGVRYVRYVRMVQYGEDFSMFQGNCFDGTGKLQFMHYQMRTAWGWGYEDNRRFFPHGMLLTSSTRFFDTKTNKTIKRPDDASNVPDFLKPAIYKSFDSLPFIGMLN